MGSKVKIDRLKKSLEILESDPIFKHAQIHEIIDINMSEEERYKKKQFYKTKLSSGHGIILLTITKLVETIEEKTLVLLDEPETHLHPPLVSSFIRCLSELLMSTNAVAIIATHSPIILQEVPKNCVWILDRSGWNCSISVSYTHLDVYKRQVTDNIDYISLEKSYEYWAKYILNRYNNFTRQDVQNQLIKQGYDIYETSNYIQNFYLKLEED